MREILERLYEAEITQDDDAWKGSAETEAPYPSQSTEGGEGGEGGTAERSVLFPGVSQETLQLLLDQVRCNKIFYSS